MAVPLFKIVALAFARNYLFHLFPLSNLFHEFFSGTLKSAETDFFWPEHWRTLSNIPYIDNSFHRFL